MNFFYKNIGGALSFSFIFPFKDFPCIVSEKQMAYNLFVCFPVYGRPIIILGIE